MEYLDIVNEHDVIIGRANKMEVYEKKLRHRIAHILVFNKKGELALQMRGQGVHFAPGHWSTTAAGHVSSGESYEQAAIRESQEEIGVTFPIKHLAIDHYLDQSRQVPKILGTFTALFEGPFYPDPDPVVEVRYFSLEVIKKMIAAGEPFHPELLFLLKRHYGF